MKLRQGKSPVPGGDSSAGTSAAGEKAAGSHNVRLWFRNLPLNRKILLLICLIAFLPLGLVLTFSVAEIRKQSEENQIYALNQGYVQVSQAVEDKLSRMHNISTILAVNDMVNLDLSLTDERALADQLIMFENMSSYVYVMEMSFDSNHIVFYIDDSFPVVSDSSGRYRSLETARKTGWYQQLKENNGKPTWVSFQEDRYDAGDSYVAITRALWDPDDYSRANGILSVSLERSLLEELLIGAAPDQLLYLETSSGSLIAANCPEEELIRLPAEVRMPGDTDFSRKKIDGTAYMVRSSLLDKSGLYLVSLDPLRSIQQETDLISSRIWLMFGAVCIFIVLSFLPLTRSILSRLQVLKEQMLLVKKGDIRKIHVDQEYQDEIGQLVTYYNEMVDKVDELIQEQYALGQEKTGAELKALQSQINPHFLYNTLDMINWMAQKNETANIRSVVQAMSRFYRLTLNRGRDIVSISDEVKMCDAYMEIQRRRYKGRILYTAEVDEEILDCMIPKITLQPFLENAIIHGISQKEDARGTVILNGWAEDGRITLSVTDDGVGMVTGEARSASTGSHYGMDNIEKRLKLFFGEEIPIQVESSPGMGTCVILNIPIRREPEEGRQQ